MFAFSSDVSASLGYAGVEFVANSGVPGLELLFC
jgi:hypothetical protein